MSLDPKRWPAFRTSPDGTESRVFARPEDVPPGWCSKRDPPKQPVLSPPQPDPRRDDDVRGGDPLPLTREQIVAALKKRGVAFQRNAATEALYAKLLAIVEATEA